MKTTTKTIRMTWAADWQFIRQYPAICSLIALFLIMVTGVFIGMHRVDNLLCALVAAAMGSLLLITMLNHYIGHLERRIADADGPVWTVSIGGHYVDEIRDARVAQIRKDVYLSPRLYVQQAVTWGRRIVLSWLTLVVLLPFAVIGYVLIRADGRIEALHEVVETMRRMSSAEWSLLLFILLMSAVIVHLTRTVRRWQYWSVFETEIEARLAARFRLDDDRCVYLSRWDGNTYLESTEDEFFLSEKGKQKLVRQASRRG